MNDAGLLLTDLYQLTMMQAYFERGMNETAVFEFFVRKLPPGRNALIAAGLEQALDFLENARFTADELHWLHEEGRPRAGLRREFIDSLAHWRFTGTVEAMPEGTLCFADEPLLRVVAPLREAQLVETRLINLLQFQTMVAAKAVRSVLAADGRPLVDFGLRRAHGAEAGLLSARASYLAGFSGTSNVLAGWRWGIPVSGTMAHAFVEVHAHEREAFESFARAYPAGTTLLIDTYDTEAAARQLVPLVRQLAAEGVVVSGVRLDSGDLGAHARRVRAIFDAAELRELRIFASGNLDETRIAELLDEGAPIDGFGVGTRMNTSADCPYLDCAYKLQEYAGVARRKRSEGKATWPGRKQVFRRLGDDGRLAGDLLGLASEAHVGFTPLLAPVMRDGRRLHPSPPLTAIRARLLSALETLPEPLRGLAPAAYPVTVSDALLALAQDVDRAHLPARP